MLIMAVLVVTPWTEPTASNEITIGGMAPTTGNVASFGERSKERLSESPLWMPI